MTRRILTAAERDYLIAQTVAHMGWMEQLEKARISSRAHDLAVAEAKAKAEIRFYSGQNKRYKGKHSKRATNYTPPKKRRKK